MRAWRRVTIDTRPLRVAPYRRLWVSTLVTAVGGTLTLVAVPLQIYQITGSSAYVGLTGLVGVVPLVVAALWGGTVADLIDRRRLLLVTSSGLAASSALLWAQATVGLRSVWVILALVGVQQGFAGASLSAQGASIARLVTLDLLAAANALNSTVRQLGGIVGPLLAGVLLPLVGLGWLYLLDAAALGVAVWAVWRLPPLPPLTAARPGAAARGRAGPLPGARDILSGLGAGFGYLATRKVLLVALLADLIAMVLGNPGALFPQLAHETFGDPPSGGPALGLLFAAFPLGYVFGGLFSGMASRVRRHGVAVTVAVCAWGLTMVGLGLSPRLWLAALFLVLGGAATFFLSLFRVTILQAAADDEMRGRMQGVNIVVSTGGPRLSSPLHGTAGALAGTTWAISGGGVLVVVAMLAAVVAFPVFWRYRATDAPSPTDAPCTDTEA